MIIIILKIIIIILDSKSVAANINWSQLYYSYSKGVVNRGVTRDLVQTLALAEVFHKTVVVCYMYGRLFNSN